MKVVGLISGGKDSVYNLLLCQNYGHEVVALANLLPSEDCIDELDSFMYQTVGHQLIEAYAQCTGLPLFRRRILGASKHQELNYAITEGDEVEDLLQLLASVKQECPEVQAVSSGAIASDYQRLRVEHVCSRLGLESLAYMWMQPQKDLLQGMIDAGIEAVLVKVAALGLEPHKHLGKNLREMQPILHKLNRRFGCNVCGEGGEYETLCLDSPLFLHGRIVLDSWEPVLHSPDQVASVGVLHPTAFHVEPKKPHPTRSCEEAAGIAQAAVAVGGTSHGEAGHGLRPVLSSTSKGSGLRGSCLEAVSPLEAASNGEGKGAGQSGFDGVPEAPSGSQRVGDVGREVTTARKQSAAQESNYSTGNGLATQISNSQQQLDDLKPDPTNRSGQTAEASSALQGTAQVVMVPDDFAALLPPRCVDANSLSSPDVDNLADSTGSRGSNEMSVSSTDARVWQNHSFTHAVCSPEVDSLSLPEADSPADGYAARTEGALRYALTAIAKELGRRGYYLQDALLVQLYLADMAHFAAANAVYQRYFPQVRPAARACVQAPLPSSNPVAVDVLLPSQGAAQRRVLHVQGISCWAPSCIGPYSQATAFHDLVFFAGQIGLDPPTMQLLSGVPAQVERSFASCQAVAIAMRVDLGSDLLGVTLFSSTTGGGRSAWQSLYDGLQAFQGKGDEESEEEETEEQAIDVYLRVPKRPRSWQPLMTFLVMPALPRGAALEVQPLTCSGLASAEADDTSSEEEDGCRPRTQERRPGWPGKLRNEASKIAVLGSTAPLQRNLLLAKKRFCFAQLSWPSSAEKMHPIGQEELLSLLQATVRGLIESLQGCGLQRQDTVSLRLYYRPDLLECTAATPGIQPVIDRVLSEEGWADVVAVCVPVLAVGWCASASAAVHLEGLYWAQ